MIQPSVASGQAQRRNSTHKNSAVHTAILHSLSILVEPGQVVELRIPGLNGKRTDSGYFTDHDKLAQAAISYNGRAEGIYITLNPLQQALLARSSNRMTEYAKHTASDKDVPRRRWIFIDFDPVRPAGISSSTEEHDLALTRAAQCRVWLTEQSVPSVLADSGNGAHLLIPIDLANDEGCTKLVKNALIVLSAKFSDELVQIDTSTANAARLIKLYSTTACKGDNIPERPHRQAALVDVPESVSPVDVSLLKSLIANHPPSLDQSSATPGQKQSKSTADSPRWANSNRVDIREIKARLDMVAYAEGVLGVSAVQDGHEYRLPGNQGFLINPEKGCWYHYGGQFGGDALDLVGYLQQGSAWNRLDASMFREALREAAAFAGVQLPDTVVSSQHNNQVFSAKDTTQAPLTPQGKPDLMDVASAWKQHFANEWAWDTQSSGWRHWMGTHWQLEREPETLDLLAVEVMRLMGVPVSSGSRIDSVIRLAQALSKRQFRPTQRLINFQNGTLDLDTMTGHTHTPTDNLTSCLPYNYERNGQYPAIAQFLSSAIPDGEGQRAYMAHVGLALIGNTSLHKALVLMGPPRSGKTTLLKLAQCTLGVKPGQFPSALLFSSESRGANSRAAWIDESPHLVCLDEFPEGAVRDEGEEIFKSMSAHGGVSMWLKYHDERAENAWSAKLMFATNNRMRYRDPSGALTRRLLVVACPNSLPDERLDGKLLGKFAPELGGFAAACIKLALQVLETGTYPESAAMRALLADIERNGDGIKLWLSENCVFEPGAFTTTQSLYNNFRAWCDDNGLHPVSRPKLRDMICGSRPGIRSAKQRVVDIHTGATKPMWGLVDIRLRSCKDDSPDEPSLDR